MFWNIILYDGDMIMLPNGIDLHIIARMLCNIYVAKVRTNMNHPE